MRIPKFNSDLQQLKHGLLFFTYAPWKNDQTMILPLFRFLQFMFCKQLISADVVLKAINIRPKVAILFFSWSFAFFRWKFLIVSEFYLSFTFQSWKIKSLSEIFAGRGKCFRERLNLNLGLPICVSKSKLVQKLVRDGGR